MFNVYFDLSHFRYITRVVLKTSIKNLVILVEFVDASVIKSSIFSTFYEKMSSKIPNQQVDGFKNFLLKHVIIAA